MSAVSSDRIHKALERNGKARSTARRRRANSPRMDPIQLIVSLVAILALSGLAWWLGLGGQPLLASEADAKRAAGEVHDGFDTAKVALDRSGAAALLQSQQGDVMLLKRHGNRFAGRILAGGASARETNEGVTVDSGEARFGSVALQLDEAPYWVDVINRLNAHDHA